MVKVDQTEYHLWLHCNPQIQNCNNVGIHRLWPEECISGCCPPGSRTCLKRSFETSNISFQRTGILGPVSTVFWRRAVHFNQPGKLCGSLTETSCCQEAWRCGEDSPHPLRSILKRASILFLLSQHRRGWGGQVINDIRDHESLMRDDVKFLKNCQQFWQEVSYLHKVTSYDCLQNCCGRQKRDVSLVEDPLMKILQRAGSTVCRNSLHLRRGAGKEKHAKGQTLEQTQAFSSALPNPSTHPLHGSRAHRSPHQPWYSKENMKFRVTPTGSNLESLNPSEPQFLHWKMPHLNLLGLLKGLVKSYKCS